MAGPRPRERPTRCVYTGRVSRTRRSIPPARALLLASLMLGALGQAAPAQAEQSATLDDLRRMAEGRPLAVVVIKGYWCQACVQQLQALSKRLDEVRAVGGAVVALSNEDQGTNAAFKRKLGFDFPVLGDPGGRLLERLGMWMPEMGHPLPGFVFLEPCRPHVIRRPGRIPGRLLTDAVIRTLQQLATRSECTPRI